MQYRSIGDTGLDASIIGLGAWAMGGGAVWGDATDDEASARTIHAALDEGINLIDTAPCYGFGHSEEVVGRALEGWRASAILATKCGLLWGDGRGAYYCEFDGQTMYRSLRPDTIREEAEHSLRRLKTDYIDLYQIHWPAIEPVLTPVEESMAALLQLKDEGKIRAIGVCNVTPAELDAYAAHGPVSSAQFRYSMLHRDAEADLIPACGKRNMAALTYMSLEQGLLTGKVGLDTEFKAGDFRTSADWNPWYLPVNRARVLELLAGWEALCGKHACSMAQLVVAWTAARDGVTHVLAGARRPEQIRDTAGAAEVCLEAEDLARMGRDLVALGAAGKE